VLCCVEELLALISENLQKTKMNDTTSLGCQHNASLPCSSDVEEQTQNLTPVVISLLLGLIGILVLLFNGGVFALVVKKKTIRQNPYQFLVLMLCVSDFLVGLVIVLAIFLSVVPGFQRGNVATILNTFFLSTGLHLSLYHTFLISFQRVLVISKEAWSSYIFGDNRKYFACVGGWVAIILGNSVLISPPSEFVTLDDVNALAFVYNGHYEGYIMYTRTLSISLLSLTVLLYLVAVVIMSKSYKKVTPIGHYSTSHGTKVHVNDIEMTASGPSGNTCTISSVQGHVKVNPRVQQSTQMGTHRRKKVISTLQLVGFLIAALVIFTGPFIVSMLWFDTFPLTIKRIFFILYCLNSVFNPIIYVWKLVDIRKMVRSTLCC
jgi:hypothetical protein